MGDSWGRRAGERPGAAVLRFMLGSVAAIAVVAFGGFHALQSVAERQAERNTRDRVVAVGRLVQAELDDGVLHSRPRSVAALDRLVTRSIVIGPVVRAKLWARDGTVLYSDKHALIGRRFALQGDEAEGISESKPAAEISDLNRPENRYERQAGKLLEAHTNLRTPNGTPVLFEIYERFSSVDESRNRLVRALSPPLVGGLLVLMLFQVPLAWGMARRLQRGHAERERLLRRAVEASDHERRRIAADLHDGVVQDLAGVAFGLAPIAADAERNARDDDAGILRGAIARLQQGIRDLRTLLVEIHPPSLETTGLEAALSDLLSPLEAEGIQTELSVDPSIAMGARRDVLVYRAAREAVRNAHEHAEAHSVRVEVTNGSVTRLSVIDDGRGFAPDERARRAEEGHVGLTLLDSLIAEAGGRLEVVSAPGAGTSVTMEVPPA